MLASIGVYLVVAASYIQPRISDDGVIYYDFMRRLVGEDVPALRLPVRSRLLEPPLLRRSPGSSGSPTTTTASSTRRSARSRSPIASTAAVVAIFYVSLAADPRARPARRAGRDPPDRLRLAALLLRDLPAGLEARVRRAPRLGAGAAPAPGRRLGLRPRAWRLRIGLVLALLISRPLREHRAARRGALRLLPPAVASPRVRGRRLGDGRSDRDPRAPARAGDSVRLSARARRRRRGRVGAAIARPTSRSGWPRPRRPRRSGQRRRRRQLLRHRRSRAGEDAVHGQARSLRLDAADVLRRRRAISCSSAGSRDTGTFSSGSG